jgi:ligand-binding sensor domain-containing protein
MAYHPHRHHVMLMLAHCSVLRVHGNRKQAEKHKKDKAAALEEHAAKLLGVAGPWHMSNAHFTLFYTPFTSVEYGADSFDPEIKRISMDIPPSMLLLIAFTSLLTSACSGQQSKKSQPISDDKLAKHDAPQLAEYVVNVFEDSKGRLWFSTIGNGVARYEPSASLMKGEKALTYFSVEEGLVGSTVTGIAEDKEGNLWFGSHSGLSKFDGETFTNYTTKDGINHERVSQVFIDKAGILWVGTWAGVCRFDGSAFTDFPLPIPDVEVPVFQATTNWVTDILQDSKGNIWFGRSGYGACSYNPVNGKFTQLTKKDGLSSNCVQAIMEDKQGNIWFGFRVAENDHPDADKRKGIGGVSRYNGRSFTTFSDMKDLNTTDVYTIYQDRAGSIWIGATHIGVYRYDGTNFTLIDKTDRMDLTHSFGLQAALEDKKGTLWFGMSGGLFKLKGSSIINVTQDGPWNP